MKRNHPTRRAVMKNLVAGGIVASGGAAMAQTKPSATTSTSLPTTKPTSVSAADLEAVDRVLGHAYTPEEREMMRGGMASKQGVITKLRKRTIPPDVEPAVRFDPRLPETKVPTGASSFSMSDAAAPAWRTWR